MPYDQKKVAMLILIVEIRQKGIDKKKWDRVTVVLITHKSIPILKNGCHAYVAWTEGGK